MPHTDRRKGEYPNADDGKAGKDPVACHGNSHNRLCVPSASTGAGEDQLRYVGECVDGKANELLIGGPVSGNEDGDQGTGGGKPATHGSRDMKCSEAGQKEAVHEEHSRFRCLADDHGKREGEEAAERRRFDSVMVAYHGGTIRQSCFLREPPSTRIVEKVKAVIYQSINKTWKEELTALEKEFPQVSFVAGLPEAEDHLADADVIISATPKEDVIDRAGRVQLIIVPITGIDHLPLEKITQRGIRLANAHGNARYVAERSVALILSYLGRIVEFHNDLAGEEKWHGFWVRQGIDDSWSTIHGKTIGIIGAGEIGGFAAGYLKAFDTTVIGVRRSVPSETPDPYDEIVSDLDEAIERSDIVLIALPSTPETRGLFNRERLGRMAGKLLVNVGRGDIVDEEALYEGLRKGTPAGAAIDTWWSYPSGGETTGAPGRFPIHKLPNVVASPHLAGFVDRAVTASIRQACENLRRFLSGRELLTEVDPKRGY